MLKFFEKSPLHLFLIAIYPILFLLSVNILETTAVAALRPVLILLIGAVLLFAVFFLITHNAQRSAVYALIVLLVFFLIFFVLYAPVYRALRSIQIGGQILGRHRILVPCTALILGAIILLFALFGKRIRQSWINNISLYANSIAILLTVFSLANLSFKLIRQTVADKQASSTLPVIDTLKVDAQGSLPDIYWIVMDMHTSDAVLERELGYDDSAFTQSLQEKGFYVSQCSQSNYDNTKQSLTSILNMDYLQDLNLGSGLYPAMQQSRVRRMLENAGYRTYAFQTNYSFTEIKDAYNYSAPNAGAIGKLLYPGVTDFESLILTVSAGQLLYENRDNLSPTMQLITDAPYVNRRTTIMSTLDSLPEIAAEPGAKFVIAHVLAPHDPFVFDADGNPAYRRTPFTDNEDPEFGKGYGWDTYVQGYVPEIEYLHQRILGIVDQIISESTTPPIIILQGDHGIPRSEPVNAQFQIYNAYYFPGQDTGIFYDTISPVNSFRLLFNTYFNMDYPLLPDQSYRSEEKFILFTEQYPCP